VEIKKFINPVSIYFLRCGMVSDTERIELGNLDPSLVRRYSVLAVHNDDAVLGGLERLFGGITEVNVSFDALKVGEGEDVVLTTHPKLNRPVSLYVLPLDYDLPHGGVYALRGMLKGHKVVFVTDKPGENRFERLSESGTDGIHEIELFGYVRPGALQDPRAAEYYRNHVLRVLEDPLTVFIFAPVGFEDARKHIKRRLLDNGNPSFDDDAKTWDEALRKLGRRKYDRIYVPDSLKPRLSEMREAHPEPRYFFFKRTNGVCTFPDVA
jgi:hypothetical protein